MLFRKHLQRRASHEPIKEIWSHGRNRLAASSRTTERLWDFSPFGQDVLKVAAVVGRVAVIPA
jgi:hypothetical protein